MSNVSAFEKANVRRGLGLLVVWRRDNYINNMKFGRSRLAINDRESSYSDHGSGWIARQGRVDQDQDRADGAAAGADGAAARPNYMNV